MRDADKTCETQQWNVLTGGEDEDEKKIICNFAGILRGIYNDADRRKWGGWRMLRTESPRTLL